LENNEGLIYSLTLNAETTSPDKMNKWRRSEQYYFG